MYERETIQYDGPCPILTCLRVLPHEHRVDEEPPHPLYWDAGGEG